MEKFNRKNHWENIYQTKELENVSWFQPNPKTSVNFFKEFKVSKTAKIIDVGGGDSYLVDYLLDMGYNDITVLDISESAINRARHRLGNRENQVKWIISDASTFMPTEKYDFWHDRATFHFFTDNQDISKYLEIAQKI